MIIMISSRKESKMSNDKNNMVYVVFKDEDCINIEAVFASRESLQRYLEEQRIKWIYFECHPSNYKNIVELFASLNYGVYDLIGNKLVPKMDTVIPRTQDLIATTI